MQITPKLISYNSPSISSTDKTALSFESIKFFILTKDIKVTTPTISYLNFIEVIQRVKLFSDESPVIKLIELSHTYLNKPHDNSHCSNVELTSNEKNSIENYFHRYMVKTNLNFNNISAAKENVDFIPNSIEQFPEMLKIVRAQALLGDIKGAEETADSFSDLDNESIAKVEIVKAQINQGDFNGAKETANSISNLDNQSIAKVEIVKAQINQGDFNGAKQTTNTISNVSYKIFAQVITGNIFGAKETANSISDLDTQYHEKVEIVEAQINQGDIDGAKQTANSISDVEWQIHAIYKVLNAQVKQGNINDAKETADSISDSECNHKARLQIAISQASQEDIVGAKETADSINNLNYQSWAKYEIVKAQVKQGDFDGAKETAHSISDLYEPFRLMATQLKQDDFDAALVTAMDTHRDKPWLGLAKIQASRGEIKQAIKTLTDNSSKENLFFSYMEIFKIYMLQERKIENAISIFEPYIVQALGKNSNKMLACILLESAEELKHQMDKNIKK